MELFKSSDISVIIPSYNSKKTIIQCLEALYSQEKPPLEIILVDSSQDETVEIVKERYPEVKILLFKYRAFPGPARNKGAFSAKGKILAFIDSDCIAARDWIKKIAENHSAGHLIVGGSIDVGNKDNPIAWAGHMIEFREFTGGIHAGEKRHIPSCNLTYRKEIFIKSGGFPNAYYPQEDLLLNFLLNLEGYKIWFDPKLVIRHFCREDFRDYLSHQHRIGRVTRCTLNKIRLPGSTFSQISWLAILLSPLIGLVKFSRTSWNFIKNYPGMALHKPGVFGYLFLGVIWWTRGFSAGARKGLNDIYGWGNPDEPILSKLNYRNKQG